MTDDDFSFSSLIKPGTGSRQSMERELAQRKANDDKRWRWEPGYVYTGTADLLLRHGQFFTGRRQPEQWAHLQGEEQRCFLNALEAAEAEPSLRYFQGLYLAGTVPCAHAWLVDSDDLVVEVTFSTTGVENGKRFGLLHATSGTTIPYLAAERWCYCGVEFDPAWAREWIAAHNDHPSILDPRAQDSYNDEEQDDDIFRHPYTKTGAPL